MILNSYDFRMKIRNYEQFLIASQIADSPQKNMEFVKIALKPVKDCEIQSTSENDFIVVYLTQT